MSKCEIKECPICGLPCKIRGGGFTHHMKWHEREGDLSKDCNIGKQGVTLNMQEGDEGYLSAAISTLFVRGATAIAVSDFSSFRKKRIIKPVLFITMGWLFDDPRAIVFGLSGDGCEVQKVTDLKLTPLIRLGLHDSLAKALIKEIRSRLDLK